MILQSDHSAPVGGRSVGQGAYLSTALAIRIVVQEVGQAVVGVVALPPRLLSSARASSYLAVSQEAK